MTLYRRSLVGLGILYASACTMDSAGPPQAARDAENAGNIVISSARASHNLDDAMLALEDSPPARVLTRDDTGRPRLVLGAKPNSPSASSKMATLSGVSVEDVARAQLLHHAATLQLSPEAARNALIESSQKLPGGAQVVRFTQRVDGIDVFMGRASVVLDAQRNLVSIANNLASTWHSQTRDPASAARTLRQRYPLTPQTAVAGVYSRVTGTALDASAVGTATSSAKSVADAGDRQPYRIATPDSAARALSVTAKRVMFAQGEALVPAYHVELLVRGPLPDTSNAAFGYVIGARDGGVLWQSPLTASESFTYRVWANPEGDHAPTEGPLADYTPHPTGTPDGERPEYVAPVLVEMEGFNSNPEGSADPWLPADAQVTSGNNVDAYSDRNQGVDDAGVAINNGFDEGDVQADLTAPRTFDRVYDVTRPPDADDDQIKAAVTQLFYVNNWLHDYFYDSGFDEASGNAQVNNYDRGGEPGDPLLAEAQDSASSGAGNNANMSTLSDGSSPRMQMYVWNGIPNRAIATQPPVALEDTIGAASFGPEEFSLSDQGLPMVLVDDGSAEIPEGGSGAMGSVSDGCQALSGLDGVIAVIDRGQCLFVDKAQHAAEAGARAVLIVDNTPGHAPPNPSASGVSIDIPVLAISFEDGQKLKAALGTASAEQPLIATRFERGSEVKHDGTIDNTVVAHEWGHYLHHRLVLCGQPSCGGMSEGFADFVALMLTIREGDPLQEVAFPLSQYATAGSSPWSAYFGIRRAPYSTSLGINPFTFGHVRQSATLPEGAPLAPSAADMSEVHNVGEIWAEMLFEGYTNLLSVNQAAGRSFQEGKRRMADYLVAGLKATPIEPTFAEQRDAILSATWAMAQGDPSRMDDFMALAKGFAKRGLGVGAIAPPVSSSTLDEAVESTSMQGQLSIDEVLADDSSVSCDADGKLDSGEAGKLRVRVSNTGWAKLENTRVKVTSSDSVVTIDDAGVAQIPALEPFGHAEIELGVRISTEAKSRGFMHLNINGTNPDAVAVSTDLASELLYNYDDVAAISAKDDIESEHSAWTPSPDSLSVWRRTGDSRNHVWHGADIGTSSDESLTSPDISVRSTVPFIINFTHRYSFETNPDPAGTSLVAYDGAVLEISEDGGATWRDISSYGDPGYTGTIFAYEEEGEPEPNALAKRPAWVGDSAGYPAYTRVSLDLGNKLAGQTVKLRFRIGTDGGAGANGWDIDDISFGSDRFTSISNTPFGALTPNAQECK